MVENLCTHYGEKISVIGEKAYYSFPTIENLSNNKTVETKLRQLGFGYRAAYIAKSAQQLHKLGGKEYLLSLRSKPYGEAREALLNLSGIGPKVADCILLMSLDKPDAIPVDTHMFQIGRVTFT